MKTLALIPCKGVSFRLPRKNMMRVGDKTLVERAVFAAVAAKPDLVVLATDDAEILAHGLQATERHHLRGVGFDLSPELAGKYTHLEDVIAAVIARHPADRYVMLQPTSPLRERRHVASAMAMLAQCDSVLSVHETTKDCYFAGTTDARGRWTPDRPKGVRLFTTELPKVVSENGAVYAWTHDCWLKTQNRSGGDCMAVEMDVDASIDIDTPAELERAQRRWGGAQ